MIFFLTHTDGVHRFRLVLGPIYQGRKMPKGHLLWMDAILHHFETMRPQYQHQSQVVGEKEASDQASLVLTHSNLTSLPCWDLAQEVDQSAPCGRVSGIRF